MYKRQLFSLHEEGPGFPFFHPKGMVVINALLDAWRKEHVKRGYQEIKTPIIPVSYTHLDVYKRQHMNIPKDLLYTPEHLWVKEENGVYRCGITDFAQEELGDLCLLYTSRCV